MLYLFELGRQPEISKAELETVFLSTDTSYTIISEEKELLFVETHHIHSEALIERLGGTIKIAALIGKANTPQELAQIVDTLQPEGKIHFSFSGIQAKSKALETKKTLKNNGRSVRYIEANNTATILHNNLVKRKGDFTLTRHGVFVTEAIQPIEEWSERDYGRPGRDSKSGMLPPKLARIMINLSGINPQTDTVLLDPFCGSGTILMESKLIGFQHIVGSDISPKAIEDTQKNIEWATSHLSTEQFANLETFVCDVRELRNKLKPQSIDTVVTEPYLGKPLRGNEDKTLLSRQAQELKDLYTQTFEVLSKIIKFNGVVVFLIPRFKYKEEWIRIHCLEEIKRNGFDIFPFSTENPYLLYRRPDQFVGREIWRFKRVSKK